MRKTWIFIAPLMVVCGVLSGYQPAGAVEIANFDFGTVGVDDTVDNLLLDTSWVPAANTLANYNNPSIPLGNKGLQVVAAETALQLSSIAGANGDPNDTSGNERHSITYNFGQSVPYGSLDLEGWIRNANFANGTIELMSGSTSLFELNFANQTGGHAEWGGTRVSWGSNDPHPISTASSFTPQDAANPGMVSLSWGVYADGVGGKLDYSVTSGGANPLNLSTSKNSARTNVPFREAGVPDSIRISGGDPNDNMTRGFRVGQFQVNTNDSAPADRTTIALWDFENLPPVASTPNGTQDDEAIFRANRPGVAHNGAADPNTGLQPALHRVGRYNRDLNGGGADTGVTAGMHHEEVGDAASRAITAPTVVVL